MTDTQQKIERLELKVNLLLGISGVQAVALTLWFFSNMLIPSSSTMLIAVLAIAVLAYVFRKRIPAIAGSLFQQIVRRLTEPADKEARRK